MTDLNEYEAFLIEMLQILSRDYQKAAEPYLRRLSDLHSLRSPAPVFVDKSAIKTFLDPFPLPRIGDES